MRNTPLRLSLVHRLLYSGSGGGLMLNVPVIHTRHIRRPVRKGAPLSKPGVARIDAAQALDRIAPDWQLHLYDGVVIDHILEVINNPRTSRTEIARRYRARHSVSST